jgi:acyl-CoA thioester hydrolase
MTAGLENRMGVRLRWRDVDMLGHLNRSVDHELLEEGRGGLMSEIARMAGNSHAHGVFVLVHGDLDYHAEVRKDHEHVEVVVRPAHVGNTSLRMEHEVRLPDATVAASGTTIVVAWDPASRGKREITQAERAALVAAA